MAVGFESPHAPPVTIYVHGTHRSTGWIPKSMGWAHSFTHYKEGLHKTLESPPDYIYTILTTHLCSGDSKKFPLEGSHIFCWS